MSVFIETEKLLRINEINRAFVTYWPLDLKEIKITQFEFFLSCSRLSETGSGKCYRKLERDTQQHRCKVSVI